MRSPAYRYLLTLLLALLAPSGVVAQSAADVGDVPQSIDGRQAQIRERIERLESRMAKLAQALAESEPDKAARLRNALEKSGQKQVKRRIDQLVEMLHKGEFSEAEKEQQALLKDLDTILALLTDTSSDADRKRAERARLEGFRRTIAELRAQQTENLQRTQAAAKDAEAAAALRVQADALEKLAEEQARLRGAASPAQNSPDSGQPSKSGDPGAAASSQPSAPPPSNSAREPRAASEAQAALEKRAKEAQEALQKAAQELDPARGSDAAQKGSGDVSEARQDMRAAESDLQKSDAGAAGKEQEQAEEKIRRAVDRLREQVKNLEERQRAAGIEQAQRSLEQRAGQLDESMNPQPGGEQNTPGQQQVKNARQNMQRATQRMGEQQPREAAPEEEQALQELQTAEDELNDALRQVRREEMEETLAALEARFRSMLQREESVRDDFEALAAISLPNWARTEHLKLAATVEVQNGVAADCETVHRLARDEGTTVILPEIVRQLSLDMREVSGRMEKLDMSPATRAILDDVLEQLRELVAAIEAKREQMQKQDQEDQGDGGQPNANALLPGSAELKLVRNSQMRINRRTENLATESSPPARQFKELARRQTELADLSRRMHERR